MWMQVFTLGPTLSRGGQGDCVWTTTRDQRICSLDGERLRVIRGRGTSGGAGPGLRASALHPGYVVRHLRSRLSRRPCRTLRETEKCHADHGQIETSA